MEASRKAIMLDPASPGDAPTIVSVTSHSYLSNVVVVARRMA